MVADSIPPWELVVGQAELMERVDSMGYISSAAHIDLGLQQEVELLLQSPSLVEYSANFEMA